MAIAIRGTTPGVSTSNTANPVTLTLNGTRQPQTGDLLVIAYGNDFYLASNMPTPSVGGSTTGVTAIASADGGSNFGHVKSFYYVVGSTGDLTVSATETGSGDEEKVLAVWVLSGADTASPLDGTATSYSNTTGSTSSHALPAITCSNTDSFLIGFICDGGGVPVDAWGPPGGSWVEDFDQKPDAFYSYSGGHEQLSASGSTGTRTFVSQQPAGTPANVFSAQGVLVAIKTASGAAAAPPPAPVQQWQTVARRVGGPWPRAQALPSIDSAAPVDQAVTPAAVTVTATGGTLVVTPGDVAVTPAAVTVSATPGTLTLAQSVTPAAVTVSVTAGSLVVTPGDVAITPAAVTVTATAGTLSVGQGLTPAAVTVAATPGSLVVTPGDVAITPTATTVTATPGSLTVVLAQSIDPAAVTVTASPGSLVVTTGAVAITPAAVTVSVTPGALGLALSVTVTGPTVTISAGSLVVTVGAASVVPVAVSVLVTPGSLEIIGGGLSGIVGNAYVTQSAAIGLLYGR